VRAVGFSRVVQTNELPADNGIGYPGEAPVPADPNTTFSVIHDVRRHDHYLAEREYDSSWSETQS